MSIIPASKLPDEVREVYPDGVDPFAGYPVYNKPGDPKSGLVLDAFVDGKVTVEKLLDNADLGLGWYVPSRFAIEFMVFIRLVLGEEPENSNPKPHYFFVDCIFGQPNVVPFFMIRNIKYEELKDRIAILASREFSKSTIVTYIILYMAAKGEIPGFGRVNYVIYVSDSMQNGVETMMTTLRKVYNESPYLRSLFEDTRLIQTSASFVRKPTTKKDIQLYKEYVEERGEKPENVPGRMKRTFTLKGVGAATGARGSRDALARPDMAIFDDLTPNEADANSETVMGNIESTIEADILPGLSNNKNRALLIGTPFSFNDPVYRRIEMGTWLPVVFPRGNMLPEDKDKFVSVWPDRHSYEKCRRDYIRATKAKEAGDKSVMRRILQEHYLRISSDADKLISDDLIQWYDRKMLIKMLDSYSLYITTDFTTTSSAKSDFSGIAVWAISSNDDFYLLDLNLKRLELQEQYDALFRLVQVWSKWGQRNVEVGVEVDGQQKAHVFALKEMMIKKGVYFNFARQKGAPVTREGILSKATGVNKFERFKYVLPRFQNHKIYFPVELKDTPDMKEALKQLTSATYRGFIYSDDFCDCVSQINLIDYSRGSGVVGDSSSEFNDTSGVWGSYDDDEETYYGSTIF